MAFTQSTQDHGGQDGDHSMIRSVVAKHGAAVSQMHYSDGEQHSVVSHHPDGHQHVSMGHPSFGHAHEHMGIAGGAY